MKKQIITILLISASVTQAMAQTSQYSCTISRKDYSQFHVYDSKDSVYLFKDSTNNRVLSSENEYRLVEGRGMKRDSFKERERNKKYMVSSAGDTVATLRTTKYQFDQIQLDDGSLVMKKFTSTGWAYLNSSGDTLTDVSLLWNKSTWNYTVTNYEEGDHMDLLNKVIMLNMVRNAYNSSKSSCPKNDYFDTNNLWFTLYVLEMNK
jgi:hypothetical protein